MTRDDIRKILENESDLGKQIDSILDALHNEIEPIKTDLKTAEAQRDNFKEELDEANATINNLEKTTQENGDIQQEIAEYKKQIEDLTNAREADKISNAIEMAVVKANGRNLKTIMPLLDREKIKIEEDGSVSGIEEQLKLIAKTDSYLFEQKEKPKENLPPETLAGETAGYEPKQSGRTKKSDLGKAMAEKFMAKKGYKIE